MKILFILQYVPYPLDSGGNQATYNMINAVKREHEVSILLYLNGPEQDKSINELMQIWNDVHFFCYKEQNTKEKGKTPNTISYKLFRSIHHSMERKMNRSIRKHSFSIKKYTDFVRLHTTLYHELPIINSSSEFHEFVYQTSRKGFDMIQVEFYESLPLIYLLPEDCIKVYVQHEIRYIRNENEMQLIKNKKSTDILQWKMQKDFELGALSHYNKIIALTETDKELMLNENPHLNIYVSPASISHQEFIKTKEGTATNKLVFIGNGDHFPNADGMMWFCQEIIPILKEKGINFKIYVTGKWRKEIMDTLLSIEQDLSFTGFVKDLSSFIHGKISIVPIRIGSGMRMKLLDSVYAISPIITTSKGCEGLPFKNQEDCLIADTASDFANHIETLIGNKELQENLSTKALRKFNTKYNKDELLQQRLNFYKEIQQELNKK